LQSIDSQALDTGTVEGIRTLYRAIDSIIFHIYANSDLEVKKGDEQGTRLSDEERRKYFEATKPILQNIVEMTGRTYSILPASTAHHILQLLNGTLKYGPSAVLEMASNTVMAAKGTGYHLDSMAIREVVKLVETILTDYRYEVREERSLNNLVKLLDIFVDVGWPEAINLVWRLDEIFR